VYEEEAVGGRPDDAYTPIVTYHIVVVVPDLRYCLLKKNMTV